MLDQLSHKGHNIHLRIALGDIPKDFNIWGPHIYLVMHNHYCNMLDNNLIQSMQVTGIAYSLSTAHPHIYLN